MKALLAGLLIALLAACASVSNDAPPRPRIDDATVEALAAEGYDALVARVRAGDMELATVAALQVAFTRLPDAVPRLQRMAPLERDVFELIRAEQPLSLGPVGDAINEANFANALGHDAQQRFYAQVGEAESAAFHQRLATALIEAIDARGEGTAPAPWPVVSAGEARALIELKGGSTLGAIYTSREARPLVLLIAWKDADGRHHLAHFDLSNTFAAMAAQLKARSGHEGEVEPGMLLAILARQGDPAAQAALGGYLLNSRPPRLDEAAHLLEMAAGTGNLIARLLFAETWVAMGERAAADGDDIDAKNALDTAVQLFTDAVAQGSPDAMYQLASLYVTGRLGDDNRSSGIALLNQAGDLDHTPSMRRLAGVYIQGEGVERDLVQAHAALARAARLGDRDAKITIGRLAAFDDDYPKLDRESVRWLEELARAEDAEAMALLADLHGGGDHVRQSDREARRWYRRAAELATDPELTNQIAWTLTVSHRKTLRDPDHALELMTKMMESNKTARRNPAYLDTWAAAYAANGNHARAVELQTEAVAEAGKPEFADQLDVLREHLELFRNGGTVTEEIP